MIADRIVANNTIFQNNYVQSNDGGAAYCDAASTFTNCQFRNNSAGWPRGVSVTGGYGGAISALAAYAWDLDVTDCYFENNYAYLGGGAIHLMLGTILRATFKDNSAGYGGAIFCGCDSCSSGPEPILDVRRSSFSGDKTWGNFAVSGFKGGALTVYGDGPHHVQNSAFSGHYAPTGSVLFWYPDSSFPPNPQFRFTGCNFSNTCKT